MVTDLEPVGSAGQQLPNRISKAREINEHPTNRLDAPYYNRYRHFLIGCGIVAYLSIAITVGVLIVYFASRKPRDRTYRIGFKPSAQRSTAYDSRPRHITTGDFNHDDHLDLAVANSGDDNIGIFINHGDGTFFDQPSFPTGYGSRPYSLAVGHFDHDTKLDIVVAHYGTNSIGVYRGDGMGKFTSHLNISLNSSRPLFIIAADLNDDSIVDVAVLNDGTHTVVILAGHNDGSFRLHSTHPMGYDSNPVFMAIGDLNGDGTLDLVIANNGTGELVVLMNDGYENFLMDKYSTGIDSFPISVALGDLNNDNRLDVATANFVTSEVGVFLGYGNGTFENYTTHSTDWASFSLQSIGMSDMNNDTLLDIIVLDSIARKVVIVINRGNGSFSIVGSYDIGFYADPVSMVIGDFDDDKKPDVAVVNYITNDMLSLRSFSIRSSRLWHDYLRGYDRESYSVSVGDFSRDGYLDVVIPDFQTHAIYIFLNSEWGILEMTQTYSTGAETYPYFVICGDVNNDEQSDIVVLSLGVYHIKIFLGNGDGTFKEGEIYSTDKISQSYMAVMYDLNSDDNLDIIVCNNRTANVDIFWGFGNGSFTKETSSLPKIDYHPKCVGVGDFNGDDIFDVAVSNSNNNTLAIFLGYGNGSFHHPFITSIDNTSIYCITIGDVNGDHRADVVYTDDVFRHVGVLLGHGNGTFSIATKYFTDPRSQPQHVTLGYYNNDTFLDIVVSSAADQTVIVLLGIGNGSFEIQDRLIPSYGVRPLFVLLADLDNDNQQEIITANYGSAGLFIFSVYYSAQFLEKSSYSTGSGPHPYSIAVPDLDNDGQSDLIIANSGRDNIQILSHHQQDVFINETIFSFLQGSRPKYVTVADFNKDQLSDIVVSHSHTGHLNVFIQLKNGSFDTNNGFSLGGYAAPNSIAAADLNKDGRMDLLITIQNEDDIAVLIASDYILFTHDVAGIPEKLHNPVHCFAADFNNDHRLDIVLSLIDLDQLAIYLGYGNGTFAEKMYTSAGGTDSPMGLDVGHFNNDDYLDIVAAYSGSNGIGIFLGYGNGSFQSPIFYSTSPTGRSSPRSVAVGDFDHDHLVDIVVANNFDHNIWIFFGHGNGSFTGQIVYTALDQSFPQWVSIADFNNDTHLDLIIVNNNPSSVSILSGYGNRRFEQTTTLSIGNEFNPYSVAIGDVNNDNRLDIAIINRNVHSITIYFQNTNGSYSSKRTYPTPWSSNLTSIVLWDVNHDHLLDPLVLDYKFYYGSVAIFYGYGDGDFTSPESYIFGECSYLQSIAMGDFDNDKRVDLVIPCPDQGFLSIFRQLKTEPFISATRFSTDEGSYPQSLMVANFNHDDHLDVAVANSATGTIGILLDYDDGAFHEKLSLSIGSNSLPIALATGDFNNDHHADLVVADSYGGTIIILFGEGNGSFPNQTIYPTGIQSDPCSVAVADLNRDSYLDVVVANRGTNKVLIFLGKGDGSLSEWRSYPMGYNARPQSVAIADINNDEMLDIIIANYGSDYVEILLQTC